VQYTGRPLQVQEFKRVASSSSQAFPPCSTASLLLWSKGPGRQKRWQGRGLFLKWPFGVLRSGAAVLGQGVFEPQWPTSFVFEQALPGRGQTSIGNSAKPCTIERYHSRNKKFTSIHDEEDNLWLTPVRYPGPIEALGSEPRIVHLRGSSGAGSRRTPQDSSAVV
jgi:hypothetical protein